MSETDKRAGYRGELFKQGMDRAEYESGKSQKETEDALGRMAGGNRRVEVPGVAFTLLLIAPMIWMAYPALGLTLWVVAAGCYFFFKALLAAMHSDVITFLAGLLGFILCVLSFFPGMILERRASQRKAYRWFRSFVRYVAPLAFGILGISGNGLTPSAITAGICIVLIAHFVYKGLDRLYFPAMAEVRKLQDKIQQGERPQRSKFKRIFFGICWIVPTLVILTTLEAVGIRLFKNAYEGRELFDQLRPVFACVNVVIWFILFLSGKLPGTGKYKFSKAQEEDLVAMNTR